jgi:hypothetical protein
MGLLAVVLTPLLLILLPDCRLVGLSLYVSSLEQPNGTLASPLTGSHAPAVRALAGSLLPACLLPAIAAGMLVNVIPAKPASLGMSSAILVLHGAWGLAAAGSRSWGSLAWALLLAPAGAAAALWLWKQLGRGGALLGSKDGLPVVEQQCNGSSQADRKGSGAGQWHAQQQPLSQQQEQQQWSHPAVNGSSNTQHGLQQTWQPPAAAASGLIAHVQLPPIHTAGAGKGAALQNAGSLSTPGPMSARRRSSALHHQYTPTVRDPNDPFYHGSVSKLRRQSSSGGSGGGAALVVLPAWLRGGWDFSSPGGVRVSVTGIIALLLSLLAHAFMVAAAAAAQPDAAAHLLLPCLLFGMLWGMASVGVLVPIAGSHVRRIAASAAVLCGAGPAWALILLLFAAPPMSSVAEFAGIAGKLQMLASGFGVCVGALLLWPVARDWSKRRSLVGGGLGAAACLAVLGVSAMLCLGSPYCLQLPPQAGA